MSNRHHHSPNPHASTIVFLIELRRRLLVYLASVGIVLAGCLFFAKKLYSLLARPLLHYLPSGTNLIAIGVTTPFTVPFKLALIASVLLTAPILLYQLWAFITPALYRSERRWVWFLLFFSSILFYLGVAFAYFVVFPLLLGFFVQQAPQGVTVSPDISQYLDFTLKLFFACGLAFEVPVATVLLVSSGSVRLQKLKQRRPYIIVSAFVISMLITPPDVISQLLLAMPLWLLFELGLFLARLFCSTPTVQQITDED